MKKVKPTTVSQINTFNLESAERGVDGDMSTRAHVICSSDPTAVLWYNMRFRSALCISEIVVFQSQFNLYAYRMDGTEVYLKNNDLNTEVLCGTIAAREEWSLEGQTYRISCDGKCGDEIELRLRYQEQLHRHYGTCIHMYEIETYASSYTNFLGRSIFYWQ